MLKLTTAFAACFLFASGLGAVEPTRTPVIVELFTSEGCSSCPPADRLLALLHEQQPVSGVEVIVLSEHVDYWNQLGWIDPFSNQKFSQRQRWYSQKWPRRIYTPQAVVDGRYQLVGSDASGLQSRITDAAAKPKVPLTVKASVAATGQVHASVEFGEWAESVDDDVDVVVALVEDSLSTQVRRGENKGRKLPHVSVVRTLNVVKKSTPGKTVETQFRLKKDWSSENLRVVAFAQSRNNRAVVAAGSAAIN